MGRIIPGKGYVKGFTKDTVPAIGFTTSREPIANPDARPVIGTGYVESTAETQLIGSGYSLIEPTTVKYAIRTQAGWDSMTAGEQAEYRGWFDTLSAWEAIIPNDLVILNEQWIAECFNDWPSGLVDQVPLSGHTLSATCNIIVTSPSSERHTTITETGFWLTNVSSYQTIITGASNVIIEYIEIKATGSINGVKCVFVGSNGILRNCLVSCGKGSGSPEAITGITTGVLAYNNLAFNSESGVVSTNYTSHKIYNNMVVDCTTGFKLTNNGTCLAINNVAVNCGIDYSNYAQIDVNSENNATSEATLDPVLGTIVDISIVDGVDFTAPSLGDYSISAGSKLIDQGTDLSLEFTTDILGVDRGAVWEIGAFAYIFIGGEFQPAWTLKINTLIGRY